MDAELRRGCIRILHDTLDVRAAREMEAECRAISGSVHEYVGHVSRCARLLGLLGSSAAPPHLPLLPDEDLRVGTEVEEELRRKQARRSRFLLMLEESYEKLRDDSRESVISCNKCKSGDIVWEEKQCRSADEAATIFCVCTKCGNRWTMR